MLNPENYGQQHHHIDVEMVGSGSSNISLDAPEPSAIRSSKKARGGNLETPEHALLPKSNLERRSSTPIFRVVSNASSRIWLMSQELKQFSPFPKRSHQGSKSDKTKVPAAALALRGLKFISSSTGGGAAGWTKVEKKFDELTADTHGMLPRSLFGECIGMKRESKDFDGKLFEVLARRMNVSGGSIDKKQMQVFWNQISDQSFDSRLEIFFDMVDKDGDGKLTEEEIREIITLSASANQLSTIKNQADEYARLIMEELDPDNQGFILIENIRMLLLQAPNDESVRTGDSKTMTQMLTKNLRNTQPRNSLKRRHRKLKYFLEDNWQRIWVMALWIGVMVGLFVYKYVQYKHKAVYQVMGACVCMAKGAAETLKLNMALILLPVCRNTITWLRNRTKLGVAVPFDDNLNFHKVITVAIGVGVGIHAIAHLTCDFPRLLHASPYEYEPMKPFFGEEQPSDYWYFIKGVEGVTGIIMVVLMAIAFTLANSWLRRSEKLKKLKLPSPLKKLTGFNTFWYSHHLFVIVYILLIVHGIKLYLTRESSKKTTWMYLAVPITLYVGERLFRAFRTNVTPVNILQPTTVYPGDVLALYMSKPDCFTYKSGQYMFVKCPAISPFEWHPFSITSAPADDYLSVHIRKNGDWTGQIVKEFKKVCEPRPTGKSGLKSQGLQVVSNPKYAGVLIDGPYGAPAQEYKNYKVVLLVGLGIGATPMISIVKDILNNLKANEVEGNSMEEGNANPQRKSDGSIFKTKKAYFYWVTKEQESFAWFKEIMNEVAESDQKGVIELHNHCTSVYEEGNARVALISMLQSIYFAKSGLDIVAGTKVKSHFARPNWRQVCNTIAHNHPNETIGIFYCGLAEASKGLKQTASELSRNPNPNTNTKFEFHKENF